MIWGICSTPERMVIVLQYLPFFLNIPEEDYYLPTAGASLGALMVFGLLLGLVMLIANWLVYTKVGKPGWVVLIPIYNLVVLLEIVGRPRWWLLLLLIPIVNVFLLFIIGFDLARSFGKGPGFALGLIFLSPIFLLILGFGGAEYASTVVPS